MNLRATVITNDEEFRRLGPEWDRLAGSSPGATLYGSFDWMSVWWDCHASPRRQLCVVTVRDGEELVGLAPVHIVSDRVAGLPVRRIEFLGMAEHADHPANCSGGMDILAVRERDAVVRTVFRTLMDLRGRWDMLRLHPVPEGSSTLPVMTEMAAANGMRWNLRRILRNSKVYFTEDWERYYAGLSDRFRRSLRKNERKLADAGRIDVREYTRPEECSEAWRHVMEVERRSWKWTKGIALNSAAYRGFYERFAVRAAERGRLRLWLLFLDGAPIAYYLCAEHHGAVEALKKGFVEEHRSLFPGGILERRLCERFANEGMRSIDFLWGDEEYKRNWMPVMESYQEVILFRSTSYAFLLYILLFPLRWCSLGRSLTDLRRRLMRHAGIRSPRSELTRMDQLE